MKFRTVLTLLVALTILAACGGGGGGGSVSPPPTTNTSPVASAGADQNVLTNAVVILDGSNSSDANSDPLTYAWTLRDRPAGSAAALVNPSSAKPSFTVDVAGAYVATLVVNDGKINSAPDSVNVSASADNAAPVASAGVAQNVLAGTVVSLDGSASSDANSDPLTFSWALTAKPVGSAAALSSTTAAKPTFNADLAGTYVGSLIVSDGKVKSSSATVSITAANANVVPVANAGVAQSVFVGTAVTLDGSASSDANGDTLIYAWTLTAKPAGSAATLSSTTAARPTFTADIAGTYVATLTVSDGKVGSNAATVSITSSLPTVADLTSRIEWLGNPYKASYKDGTAYVYARNVWDMQYYQGSIYLGAGNSSNYGPAQNAGPVSVIRFDMTTQTFIKEFVVDEEQIDVYNILDGELYVPGHDPTQTWDWGNLYRREIGGAWVKYRNIPNGIHTYSLTSYGGKIFGAVNVANDGAAVSASQDRGKTWEMIPIGLSRVYGFLTVGSALHAIKEFPSAVQWNQMTANDRIANNPIFEFVQPNSFIPRADITREIFFPNTIMRVDVPSKIFRPLAVADKGVYIGAYTHNDHQCLPFGVYIASSMKGGQVKVDRMAIPESYRPWDLLLKDGYLYVLVEVKGANKTMVKVIRSRQDKLPDWSDVFQFDAPTFARSFEAVNNDFYFALGSEIVSPEQWQQSELRPETGEILRIQIALP